MKPTTEHESLRGVNLGGWLVLEKWMTPKLFAGFNTEDEVGLVARKESHERLEQHRKTFVTEDDVRWLAQQGVTAVRVPVGHWIFGDVAPYVGCIEYLDWLVEMAGVYKLSVVIDLHRTPGSADGHDNSLDEHRTRWFDDPRLQEQTLDILERLAQRYGQFKQVFGIEILNEPKVRLGRIRLLRRFYQTAYTRMVAHMRPGMAVIFSDGFLPLVFNGSIRSNDENPAVMDVHYYHFQVPFDGWRTLGGHLRKARRRRWMIWWLQRKQPVIIGEWSVVISGRKTRRVSKSRQQEFVVRYGAVQQEAHRSSAGAFYWSYKTQEPGIWNFRSLVDRGDLMIQ